MSNTANTNTIADTVNNITDKIKNLNDTTSVYILNAVSLALIVLSIIVYLLYTGSPLMKGLRDRNNSFMNTVYGSQRNSNILSTATNTNVNQNQVKFFHVKSAYNACSGGSYKNDYVDINVLKKILSQGVRFVDFELYSIDDIPVVATSTNDSFYVKETFNYVNFSEVLKVITDNAFNSSIVQNPDDPIFLHLRIKSTNKKLYETLAKLFENESIKSVLTEQESVYKNGYPTVTENGETSSNEPIQNCKLSDIQGKIIIIVDGSNRSFYGTKFETYIDMLSKSSTLRGMTNYEIVYTPDGDELKKHNIVHMTIGFPDKGANPPNPNTIVMRELGCQFVAMRYQLIDAFLEENNSFFDNNKAAFVLDKRKIIKGQTIPNVFPQDINLSYDRGDLNKGTLSINFTR